MKRLCYIAPPSFRTSLLQEHFYETELYEIKFLSLRDLLEAHFGSIDAVLATIFLFKKGYRDFIAIEMLLEKLRFIPLIITVNSPELLQLVTLKQELLAAGCISQKSTIFDLLKDPEATIYLAYQDHLKTGVFSIINDILKWHGINEVQPYLIPPINNHYFHRLLNEQEELLFSLNEIASLLDKGTKLESIRIMIPEHERLKISLKEMAARFNIPLRLNETILLKDLVIAKEFMKYYSLPHPVKTDLLKEFVHAAMNKPYPFKTEFLDYISLLMPKMDPLSSYDVRELLNYLFQLERFSLESDDHGVLVISPRDDAYDKHLFILGSNSEFYPPRIKEELPFNDLELQELGLLNYRRFNQNAINYHLLWHNYIYTKTTHVYYSKVFFSKNYLPFNPFYDQGAFLMKPASSSLETLYSKKAFQDYFYFMDYLHARYRLNFPLRSKLSQYFKKEPAPNYDFKNQNVSFLKSKDSVSRLNDFLLCPFRYYLDYVVNLRDFRPSIQTMIGTLLHQILEVYISLEPQDYDTIFDQRYQKLLLEENLTPVEQVIILNIRDFSHRCADVILNRIKSLNQKYQVQIFTEYHFDDENVGTIDLILVVGNFYFILDYKTTNMKNLTSKIIVMKEGKNVQLPLYARAIQKEPFFINKELIGVGYYASFIKNKEVLKDLEKKMNGVGLFEAKHQTFVEAFFDDFIIEGNAAASRKKTYLEGLIPTFDIWLKDAKEQIDLAYQKGRFNITPNLTTSVNSNNKKVVIDNPCEYCEYLNICHYQKSEAVMESEDERD